MPVEDQIVHLLIDNIQGTCSENFEDTFERIVESNPEFASANKEEVEKEFYTHVDNCSTCGWWCSVEELSDYGTGELTCDDCAPEDS